MHEMTSHERFSRAIAHREPDRVPITDVPWAGTIERWHREGMPRNVDWQDYFGVDRIEQIGVDITPRYAEKVLEETADYIIKTSPWGVTMKHFKEADSTPEFIDFTITGPEAWEKAKARMVPSRDRIDWGYLEKNYPLWRKQGSWLQGVFWFGFDVAHSWMAGTETFLIALLEQPEWAMDVFDHYLNMCIAQFDMVWDAGYHFDSIYWPDDMGYKLTPFFSTRMYRQLLKPFHKKAADWAHAKGIPAHLHSCGFIMPHLPDIIDAGIDILNPIERKAGMDVLQLKKDYGEKITLHGGFNAVLWDHQDAIMAEIESLLPALKEGGGYIFSSDHSIPNTVSLEAFRTIIGRVKELGRY